VLAGPDHGGGLAAWLRLESLRPFKCCLTPRDHALLEDVLSGAERRPLLQWLIRAKMADARRVPPAYVEADIATTARRLVFVVEGQAVEGQAVERGAIVAPGHAARPNDVPLATFLGLSLLGLKTGQQGPLLRADGSVGEVLLVRVEPAEAPEVDGAHAASLKGRRR
jgi:hypothetical protein